MSMKSDYTREAEFAREAVTEAGLLCRRIQTDLAGSSIEKPDRTPVTIADFASQALAAGRLRDEFPADPVVAEEGSDWLRLEENRNVKASIVEYLKPYRPEARESTLLDWIDHGAGQPGERFWTLDPIDGTAGFLRGEQWVVALALIEGGEVKVAALAAPAMAPDLSAAASPIGSCIVAVRGGGSWIGQLQAWKPIRLFVSQRKELARARILGSVVDRHTDPASMDRLGLRLGTKDSLIRIDSQAKFVLLAGGRAELMFRLLSPERPNYREKIWDQAAGSLIIEEAGGLVTDLHGDPLDFSTGTQLTANRGVFASNGALHDAGLEVMRELGIGAPG
jgi:3'(2'), 5'-bisphosphate nucleotidase